MYTAEEDKEEDYDSPGWSILDPDGDWICTVPTRGQAETLLSHLNGAR